MCVCIGHREDFTLENIEQESQARLLLDQAISLLQSMSQQNSNVVDKMKLMQISRNMVNTARHHHRGSIYMDPLVQVPVQLHPPLFSRICASLFLLFQSVCHRPLEFAVMVRNILRNESTMLSIVRELWYFF